MVPPDRSIPRLNPLRWSGSFRYACTTRMVAITVGIRQMMVRDKKLRCIVPPVSNRPAVLAGGSLDRHAASGGSGSLGLARGLVAGRDPVDRTLEDADPRVGRVVHLEGHLVLVLLDRHDHADDARRGDHLVVLLEVGQGVLQLPLL